MTKTQRKYGCETLYIYDLENDLFTCEFNFDGKYLLHVFLPDWDGPGEPKPHGVSGTSDKVTKSQIEAAVAELYAWREKALDHVQKHTFGTYIALA